MTKTTTTVTTATTEIMEGQTAFQSTGKAIVLPEIPPAPKSTTKAAAKKKPAAGKKSGMKFEKIEKVKAEIVTGAEAQKGKSIKEKELDLQALGVLTDKIRSEMDGIAKSFCKIGYFLYQIKDGSLYEQAGCKNISEYGEKALNLKKSSTSNYIKVCEQFGKRVNGRPTGDLMDDFKLFSYTQLTELLTIPAAKIADVKPEMTVKEIRRLKLSSADKSEIKGNPYADGTLKVNPPVELFNRILTEGNLLVLLKLLKDHVGNEIVVMQYPKD